MFVLLCESGNKIDVGEVEKRSGRTFVSTGRRGTKHTFAVLAPVLDLPIFSEKSNEKAYRTALAATRMKKRCFSAPVGDPGSILVTQDVPRCLPDALSAPRGALGRVPGRSRGVLGWLPGALWSPPGVNMAVLGRYLGTPNGLGVLPGMIWCRFWFDLCELERTSG
jgi:hypothetical protein